MKTYFKFFFFFIHAGVQLVCLIHFILYAHILTRCLCITPLNKSLFLRSKLLFVSFNFIKVLIQPSHKSPKRPKRPKIGSILNMAVLEVKLFNNVCSLFRQTFKHQIFVANRCYYDLSRQSSSGTSLVRGTSNSCSNFLCFFKS